MTLENIDTQKLFESYNLLFDSNYSYNGWLSEGLSDDEIREILVDDVLFKLDSLNYDGPDDYHAMYWFVKGLELHAPRQPKRYITSDDYLFNNLHKVRIHDKLNDFRRERIRDKFKNERIHEDSELHKKDSSFLKNLMEHHHELSKFNKYHKKHKIAEEEHAESVDKDYKTANKLRFKSYKEFRGFENDKDGQREVINDIIEEITKDPLNSSIDFRKLNNYGKNPLRKQLLNVLLEYVAPRIRANQKFMIRYFIDGQWHGKPLNDELWMQLINGLQNDNVFDAVLINEDGTPIFRDQAVELTIAWYFFEVLEFKQSHQNIQKEYKKNEKGVNKPDTYEGRNGVFFPYWNNTDLDLSRYQILHKNDDFLMNKVLERMPCEIFAFGNYYPKNYMALLRVDL